MKLQRVANRSRGDKKYYKWQITIPPEIVEQLGWQAEDEIQPEVRGGKLQLAKITG